MIENNSTRCTTIFRDTKQFFTVHNKLSRYKTIFHSAQQAFGIQNNFSQCTTSFEKQNKFSRCTTSFHDAVDPYVEQNSVSRCKIKFHDAQQKFERLVTSTGNFISRDHTTSWSLPPCFVNYRATQLTAASLLPTGDEKEIITYYFSRGYEYDAIVHFLAKFPDITMSIRTLKVAYYSFIRVQEVYTINVQFNLFFCINILITNKNPYMRQLLLQISVWEVKGARNGKTVYD